METNTTVVMGMVATAAASRVEQVYRWAYEDLAQSDPMYLFYGVLNVWGMLIFWGFGLLFLILDMQTPEWALRYKIQPNANVPLERAKLVKGIKRICFNQFVVASFFSVAFGYLAIKVRGNPFRPEDIYWSPVRLLFDVLCITACEEIGFFFTHKWCHEIPFLYKNVHKIHHEWTAPIAITAVYAHPLEHILCNLGPIALGPLVSGCHVWLIFVWIYVALTATLVSHCGYHFPFLSSPEKHDFHHKMFNVNYGVLGLLDRVYGTDAKWRKDVSFQRHKTYYSLTPIREQIPDPVKKSN